MWGRPPKPALSEVEGAVRAERSSAGLTFHDTGGASPLQRRALLARTTEGGCPHMFRRGFSIGDHCKLRQILPEELSSVHHLPAAHMKQIHGQHSIFVVISKHIRVVAFGRRYPLPLL